MQQPVARIDVVRDTYFGTTIEDPYRWMENWKGEEFQAWVKEQAACTRAYLDALPGRDTLLAQLTALNNAGPILSYFQIMGERVFYLRRDPGENMAKLVVRLPGEQEKTLFDPNLIEGEAQTAIDWYFPSWDGRYLAYGISQGGSESSVLHVLEVDSGTILDLVIPHTEFTHVSWLEDNRSFVYHRFPARPAGTPETERFRDGCTYLHRLGEDPASDRPVFGANLSAGVEVGRDDYPFLMVSPLSDWMIGLVVHGDLEEQSIYAAPRDGVAYPAVLITAGANDPRVVIWQAAKMAARLQAATSSGKPILLRVEFQGGHGMGSTQQQFNEEYADTFAFLCQQMGIELE